MENDKEMVDYIYKILLTQPTILMSWGFQSPRIINQGFSFFVKGCKHKGKVSIQYNEGQDLFDVQLLDDKDKTEDTIKVFMN